MSKKSSCLGFKKSKKGKEYVVPPVVEMKEKVRNNSPIREIPEEDTKTNQIIISEKPKSKFFPADLVLVTESNDSKEDVKKASDDLKELLFLMRNNERLSHISKNFTLIAKRKKN